MVPIYEQLNGRGIGYSEEDFFKRFIEIVSEYSENGTNKSFAFIVYDMQNTVIRNLLRDNEVFTKLDRLSGNELTIFYFHSKDVYRIRDFNHQVLRLFHILDNIEPPYIVFSRFKNKVFYDITVAKLNTENNYLAFHEIHSVIEKYKNHKNIFSSNFRENIQSFKQIVRIEVIREFINILLT